MDNLGAEIALVVALILLGGAFNAAEASLISLRESQVRALAATRGRRGQRLERLVSDPNRFLAAVQIGVTVATMLSSAFGAATIAARAAVGLTAAGLAAGLANTIALIGITLILAFTSLVLGELTPKRLGLQRRESIALLASGPLTLTALLFTPVVWLLGQCTNGAVRLLGGDPHARSEVISEEELQGLVQAHESLTSVERKVISDVFAAEDTLVREVMVARPDVEFLPASMTLSRAVRQTEGMPHSRFPVIGRDADEVVGVVHITDILTTTHPLGRAATVGDVAHPVTVMPGTNKVLDALQKMRTAGQYLAVIVDEYGGTDGIVTIEDLIEEIVGEMHNGDDDQPQSADETTGALDGLDGRLNLDDFAEQTGVVLDPGPYDTAGGYVMARLGRVPREGDRVLVAAPTDDAPREDASRADAPWEDASRADAADGDAVVGDATSAPDEYAADASAGDGGNRAPGRGPVHLVVMTMEGRRVARIAVVPVPTPVRAGGTSMEGSGYA